MSLSSSFPVRVGLSLPSTLSPLMLFQTSFPWYLANSLVILVTPVPYILSIHNGGDGCNICNRVLLYIPWHLKMVKITWNTARDFNNNEGFTCSNSWNCYNGCNTDVLNKMFTICHDGVISVIFLLSSFNYYYGCTCFDSCNAHNDCNGHNYRCTRYMAKLMWWLQHLWKMLYCKCYQ